LSSNSVDNRFREIAAVLRKELLTELRTKSGLLTAALFSVVAVVAVAFASGGAALPANLAAGLLWVTLLFAAAAALPRAFVVEDEQGTGDLLRLMADPHAVFWGKALFNLFEMLLTGLVLSLLFAVLTNTAVSHWGLYAASLAAGCAALAGTVTLCGALVSQATNRWTLAAAVSLPVLVPLIALGVSATRVSFGAGSMGNGILGCEGLVCYAVAGLAAGPYLFAAVWRT
jgi:heme exporter protein B